MLDAVAAAAIEDLLAIGLVGLVAGRAERRRRRAGDGLELCLVDGGEVEESLAARILKQEHRIYPRAIQLYSEAAAYAKTKGIIIADTKFEFGVDAQGKLFLIDEILTPDSSRFWPAAEYRTGISPPSFDKQIVRNWLETQPWDKKHPAPRLPAEVLTNTSAKYREVLRQLTS